MTSANTVTFTATANTYTVTLDADGGNGGKASVTATYNSAMPSLIDTSGNLVLPTRTGYSFGGYYEGRNGTGTQYYTSTGASNHNWDKATDNTSLYAKWTPNTYKFTATAGDHITEAHITYVNGGTTIINEDITAAGQSVEFFADYGSTISAWTVAAAGYTADNPQGNPWTFTKGLNAETHTFTATANTYEVSFNVNGGARVKDASGNTYAGPLTVTFGSAYGVLPSAEKLNYTFAGWFTDADGGEQVTAESIVSIANNHTLYAHWAGAPYYIDFANAGQRNPVNTNIGVVVQIDAPQGREHYNFKGWMVTGDVDGAVAKWGTTNTPDTALENGVVIGGDGGTIYVENLSSTMNGEVLFTAQWERITHKVTAWNNTGAWTLRITGDAADNDAADDVPAVDVSLGGDSSDKTKEITFAAGVEYTLTATVVKAAMSLDLEIIPQQAGDPQQEFQIPYKYGAEGDKITFSREANTADGCAVFKATYTMPDALAANTEWTNTPRRVKVELGEADGEVNPNPNNESSLKATVEYASADTSRDVKVTAKDGDGSRFLMWGSPLPNGTTGDTGSNPLTVSPDTANADITLKVYYEQKPVEVSANVHGATLAVVPLAADWVTVIEGTEGDATSEVGYGQSATWKITIPQDSQDNPGGHGFAGWYDASGVCVSMLETYTIPNITSATTLYAKLTSTIRVDTDANGAGVSGEVKINNSFATTGWQTATATIGDTVTISASASSEGSYFAGWYSGRRLARGGMQPFAAEHRLTVNDNAEYCAYFIDRAEVYFVAFYNRLASDGTTYGDYGEFTVSGDEEAISEITAQEGKTAGEVYAERSGNPLLDGGDTANAKFYQVLGISKISVQIAQAAGNATHGLKRVYRHPLPEKEGREKDTLISSALAFDTLVTENCAYIAEWGNVSVRRLEVNIVLPSSGTAGGSVKIGSEATGKAGTGQQASGNFEIGKAATAIALPDNGYSFAGWYDNAQFSGTPISADSIYMFAMPAPGEGETAETPITLYAKFAVESTALYKWEGGAGYKQLHWKSKVYELSKPANLTSVRIDTQAYPVRRFKAEAFSSPDKEGKTIVDFNASIASQTMRRLPARRPERYFQIDVENNAEVDAIVVGTSGEGLAT